MNYVILTKEKTLSRMELMEKALENSNLCFPENVKGKIVIKPNFYLVVIC